MQKSTNIANTEIKVNTNQQFSVFYSLKFHKKQPLNNIYFSCPKNEKNVDKIKKS